MLSPGWYIQVASAKGGLSFFRSPSVPGEEGKASVGFMDINRTTLEHGRWITIFELVGRGAFDNKGGVVQFLMEDRKGGVDPGSGDKPVNTSFKRPRFQSIDFGPNTTEGETLTSVRWETVEKNFRYAGARLLTIEGEVGHPLEVKPFSTLWKGVESLDANLGVLNAYVQVQLTEKLQRVADLA